ncbi:MAG: hypothetical protein JSW28_10095 [Thermoplasmata archaeon]|nr:MAG: hypothetical protein JSW28_10095 [Thermoplasmata archaeon]
MPKRLNAKTSFFFEEAVFMYQQIENILSKVARSTESSFLAISAAQKSLSNMKDNPKTVSQEDEEDVLKDIEKTEIIIGELEKVLSEWLKKHGLGDAIRFSI